MGKKVSRELNLDPGPSTGNTGRGTELLKSFLVPAVKIQQNTAIDSTWRTLIVLVIFKDREQQSVLQLKYFSMRTLIHLANNSHIIFLLAVVSSVLQHIICIFFSSRFPSLLTYSNCLRQSGSALLGSYLT